MFTLVDLDTLILVISPNCSKNFFNSFSLKPLGRCPTYTIPFFSRSPALIFSLLNLRDSCLFPLVSLTLRVFLIEAALGTLGTLVTLAVLARVTSLVCLAFLATTTSLVCLTVFATVTSLFYFTIFSINK